MTKAYVLGVFVMRLCKASARIRLVVGGLREVPARWWSHRTAGLVIPAPLTPSKQKGHRDESHRR